MIFRSSAALFIPMLILYLVIFYLFVVWMAHLAAVTIFSNDFQNLLMGNTSVFSTGAFVAVEIYEFPGYGGSNLTGKVYLNVEKSSVAADSLNIRFFGLERSCIEYVEMVTYENETRMETRRAFQNADIVNIDYILCPFNGSVSQGRYEFPFQITLPVGLPGKQGIEVLNGSFFLIEYHLEARLHRHGMLTWDVHNSIEVLLKDPPYNRIPTPVFLPPHSIPVMFMCCFNSGNMTLGIKLDSNNLVVNELARVGYELSNESTSRIKALEISLHQIIEFSAMGRQYIDTNEWARRRIDASELENVLPLTDKNAILPDRDGMLINSLANMTHFVELLIPFQCRSSFSGKLGFVRHYIRARIITPFGEENPEVDCPVYVHNTAVSFVGVIPAVRQPFTRPVNWQPMNQAAPVFLNPPIESRFSLEILTIDVRYIRNVVELH